LIEREEVGAEFEIWREIANPASRPSVELASVSRIGKTNRRDRGHHYFGIEAHRPVAGIKIIKGDAPVECRGAAAADLPKARDPRTACVVSAYGV
jgi:hypothetical protein